MPEFYAGFGTTIHAIGSGFEDAVLGIFELTGELFGAISKSVFENTRSLEFTLIVAMTAVCFLVGIFLQRWNKAEVVHALKGSLATYGIFAINIAFALITYVTVKFAEDQFQRLGVPALSPDVWADVSLWVVIPLVVIVYDFADYWNHRVMHSKWLWPTHAIHHSDERITPLTTYRVHFLEQIIMSLSYVLLATWAGFPAEVVAITILFSTLHNAYVHMNLDWNHGPFHLLLASPRYHSWHHADVPEAHGKNLANVFPFWDRMFGTYYNPGVCRERTGAEGLAHANVMSLLLFPFMEWGRMIKQSVRECVLRDEVANKAAGIDVELEFTPSKRERVIKSNRIGFRP